MLVGLTLATTLLLACSSAPTPEVEVPLGEARPPDGSELEGIASSAAIKTQLVYSGEVRSESLWVEGNGEVGAYAFDTPEGSVFVGIGEENAPFEVATRAQVGCLIVGQKGTVTVGVLQRGGQEPVSSLVVYELDAAGQKVGANWSPTSPALWVEAGSRCAFVEDAGVVTAVVVEAREAKGDATLELWVAPFEGEGHAFETGSHVPMIRSAVSRNGVVLLALEQIHEAKDGTKHKLWTLAQVDAAGGWETIAVERPSDSPLSVSAAGREVLIAWSETGLVGPAGSLRKPHLSVLGTWVTLPLSGVPAATVRAHVVEALSAKELFETLFVGGRWWAVMAAEPYVSRGKAEEPPHTEYLVPIEEGNAALSRLVDDLYGIRGTALGGEYAHSLAIGLGPAHEVLPEVSVGVYRLSDLEAAAWGGSE
ncbi:MAG: hypothetical protein AUK47_23930 [Deltaproteobacteria bacterium CG2_30_63_29]|nr:MAG: hypothetical protein AUK47_23930 [Deltaproteobacteria bacterium CG2_30_63_29]PJB35737.1 MAG: hypothetical protein CO108_24895 [Deltaproteobacteria bacterium CG_4_9_14_3_um_filter_63_12]